ncbi:hypothetical protein Trydic_g16291 [Trypoxylus dichotomus]
MNDVRDYKLKDGLLYNTVKRDTDTEVDLYVAPQSMRKTLVIKYHDLRSYPGPFITSNRGSKYVLAMIDNLTKFVQLEAVRNTKADVRRLEAFTNQFGGPGRIISDRGTSFTATRFEEFCDKHRVKHTLHSSRHPQANGLVERWNATILPMMRISAENSEGRDWDKYIKKIERDKDTSENKSTGKTPFELLYRYLLRFEEGPLRYLTTDNENYLEPKHMQDNARKYIADMQSKYKERYDQHRYEGLKYFVGDIVYVKTTPISTDIIETSKRPQTTAHVSQLKLWKNYNPEEEMNQTDEMEETDEEEQEDGVRNCNERSRRKGNKPKYLEDYTE